MVMLVAKQRLHRQPGQEGSAGRRPYRPFDHRGGLDGRQSVRRVLEHRPRYAKALDDPQLLDRFSWHRQEEVLRDIHGQVLGRECTGATPMTPPGRRPERTPSAVTTRGGRPAGRASSRPTDEVARFEVYAWMDVFRLIARLRASIIVLGLHHASSAGAAALVSEEE
jgi:hypothetical protein